MHLLRYEGKSASGVPQYRLQKKDEKNVRQYVGGQAFFAGFISCLFCATFLAVRHTYPYPILRETFPGLPLKMGVLFLVCAYTIPISVFVASAYSLGKFWRGMKNVAPSNEVSSQFGLDESALTALAREHAVKPRYNINGRDYYNMADFGDITTLLRASVEPNVPQAATLLRPAGNVIEASPETLLRAAASIMQPPLTMTTAATDADTLAILRAGTKHGD